MTCIKIEIKLKGKLEIVMQEGGYAESSVLVDSTLLADEIERAYAKEGLIMVYEDGKWIGDLPFMEDMDDECELSLTINAKPAQTGYHTARDRH